ncbi:MAG: Uncharacterized protein G01um101470_797 [Parcubacteria group bacterium Gr01-1014_70]|nr:MAG: Uncharacterized protein G01um101470_797 [Parcubacteria group bacterium Gr01-1014_70]
MNWFLISLLAQFILGTATVFDKLLLKKSYPNPIGYTFWIGILGLIAVFLLPFGFEAAEAGEILYALWGGALFMLALLFFYWALYYGEASGAVIAVGGLSPMVTLFFSSVLLGGFLSGYQWISFVCLLMGSFFLVFTGEKETRFRVITYVLMSAVLFGYSNIVSKQVFEATTFVTGFFWLKMGGVLFVLLLLLYGPWRRSILRPDGKDEFQNKLGYFVNRAYAGAGSLLIYYAIALGVPPLIDAMQAVRFLFMFLGGWLLLRETFRGRVLVLKLSAFVIISLGILILGVGEYLAHTAPDADRPLAWGVTFSQKFSGEFDFGEGRTWRDNYNAILDDLGVRKLRLIAYWDIIESSDDVYDFSGLDYQMRRAEEVGASVILVVGKKVPRWPECHEPDWTQVQSAKFKVQSLLDFIEVIVKRYKDSPALTYWQVENEPFLPFGDCLVVSRQMLDEEIKLVRSLDSAHPILTSDSGEIGLWYFAAKRGNAFGTTMYRRVYNDFFGYIDYHLPPEFFRLKQSLTRFFLGDYEKPFLVVELAAEPWLTKRLADATLEEQFRVFDFEFFKDSLIYAKDAGFDEYYMWGAEWWYWLKTKHNDSRFWDEARVLF